MRFVEIYRCKKNTLRISLGYEFGTACEELIDSTDMSRE